MKDLPDAEYSFKNPFTQLTTVKAIIFIVLIGIVYFSTVYLMDLWGMINPK